MTDHTSTLTASPVCCVWDWAGLPQHVLILIAVVARWPGVAIAGTLLPQKWREASDISC